MKKNQLLLSFMLLLFPVFLFSQGFNYQSVIRNNSGEVVADRTVGMRISIIKGSMTGDVVLEEEFAPTTNEFGLVNIVIGSENPAGFAAIDWSDSNYFLKVELDINGGTDYAAMGTSQLLSVPYAQYAYSVEGWHKENELVYTHKNVGVGDSEPFGRLRVVEDDESKDDVPIFEVKNKQGETIFTVYHNRVEVNFEDDGSLKTRGGFAVSGRTSSKEQPLEFFTINTDQARIYINNLDDKTRGGFAVSGRTSSKDLYEEIFVIQPGLVQIFVDNPPSDKTRGGFAVSGRTSSKDIFEEIFTVQPGLTQVFIGETTSKTRGGFAVSGRTSSKDDGLYDILSIRPERTEIFINPNPDKFFNEAFSISSYDDLFDFSELFTVSQLGAVVNPPLRIAPRVNTTYVEAITEISATIGGKVLDYGGTPIVARGVVYSQQTQPGVNIDPSDPLVAGIIYEQDMPEGGMGDFSIVMEELMPNNDYYARAFAINEDTLVGYGAVKTFKTEGFILEFEVYDLSNSQHIPDATVSLNYLPYGHIGIIENLPGNYIFDVGIGEYNYDVTAEGYFDELNGFVQVSEEGQIVAIYLEPAPVQVIFHVKNSTGLPVEGVYVYLREDPDLEPVYSETTRYNGTASLYPNPGTWYYEIYDPAEDYYSTDDLFTVGPGEVLNVHVELIAVPKYKLTLNVEPEEGGTTTGQGDYKESEEVLITAIANEGYIFIQWTGDTQYVDDKNAETTQVIMPGENITIIAKFIEEVKDIDGNLYEVVIIGEQLWLSRNLGTTRFNTGGGLTWHNAGEVPDPGPYYTANPVPGDNATDFGYVYSQSVINDQDRNICPFGWKVPSQSDWLDLINNEMGGQLVAGGKMKTIDTDVDYPGNGNWYDPNTGATNESGFAAQPASFQSASGYYYGLATSEPAGAYFWSSYSLIDNRNMAVNLEHNSAGVSYYYYSKTNEGEDALSVRCIYNNGLPELKTAEVSEKTDVSATSGGDVYYSGTSPVTEKGVVWSTEPYPTTGSNEGITNDGAGSGTFVSEITGLTPGTTYYVRAYATNNAGTAYGGQKTFATYYDMITDVDGNIYGTIVIDGQEWMAENLQTTQYNDETAILVNENWGSAGTYAIYPHGEVVGIGSDLEMLAAYGILYNWYAVNTGKLCPAGWHVPDNMDWQEIEDYANSFNPGRSGSSLKSCRQVNSPRGGECNTNEHPRWNESDAYGTDDFGFAALPAGSRTQTGNFSDIGEYGFWWASNQQSEDWAHILMIDYYNDDANISQNYKESGHSVRCIRYIKPKVTTNPVSVIKDATAVSGGIVTNEGIATVVERGIVWSTTVMPTIEIGEHDGITTDGGGLGEFESQITGLAPNTTYDVRAYAKNSHGTSYGAQVQFTTLNSYCGIVEFIYNGEQVIYGTLEGQSGTCWLDRNLGSARAATSYSDSQAQGDIFQWGRLDDGHQNFSSISTADLSDSDVPGHDLFIVNNTLSPFDWRSPQNDNLWQGDGSINDVCPTGWRLPTAQELDDERLQWSPQHRDGAYASSLKFTVAGYRMPQGTGGDRGLRGHYWTSTVDATNASLLYFDESIAQMQTDYRAKGASVRCIQDVENFSEFAGGSGTQAKPYLVETDDHLNNVRLYPDTYFRQIADIDLTESPLIQGDGWVPIGDDQDPFTGDYNGNGHIIKSLELSASVGSAYMGLFGYIDGARVYDLGVEDAYIIADINVGVLAGYSRNSVINRVYVTGNIVGNETVGGLVGNNDISSSIVNSYSMVYVNGSYEVGGLVGNNTGSVSFSYSTGEVPDSGNFMGGFSGRNDTGSITDSYWDTETSGILSSAGGVGKPTIDMIKEITYESWDFATTWDIFEMNTYPFLQWQDNPGYHNYPEYAINPGGGVTDFDSNFYLTVIIGELEWMAENLRVTHYNNGNPITTGLNDGEWSSVEIGVYAVYPHEGVEGINSDPEMLEAYGALYNWYAVQAGNLCPDGWRVPIDEEWKILEGIVDTEHHIGDVEWDILGWRGYNVGKRLKAAEGWANIGGGTDNYGFSARPAGSRNQNGIFELIEFGGWWWSATEGTTGYAASRQFGSASDQSGRANLEVQNGLSVRCVKNLND